MTPDTTPPAAIASLALGTWTQTSVLVSWSSPGDDGGLGTATSYDLRFSTSAITAANFSSATPVTGEPVPAVAGTTQSMTVSGLAAGTSYFFAIKTADEIPNTSAISNVPTGSTLVTPDTTPPAAIANLALGTWTQSSVLASWTAPGDDNAAGTAASYDLRYSTSAITAANFGSATPVAGEPVPAVAGTTQNMTVSGLAAGTSYFFAMKTADEVPNTAAISNVPTGSTQQLPDTTPPATITTLGIANMTSTAVSLTWMAPGDDGSSGTAATYDVRWSTGIITADDFGAATPVPGPPSPSPAGAPESLILSGLLPGQAIWVAVRACDEVGNWSGLSNTPSATPPVPADEVAPAGVTSLVVESVGPGWMTVRWNAPGDDNLSGQAASYDLRLSTSAVTALTFGDAASVDAAPAPAPAGASQSKTLLNLLPGIRYWVALKTVDEAGNWSPLSNVVNQIIPLPPDTTPPAEITLQLVEVDTSSAILSWTAPGDDGVAGRAARYEVRRSTTPLTVDNFDLAIPVPAPSPANGGTLESMTVSGLTPGSTWWFAIRAADEAGDVSPFSASLLVETPDVDDPPDASPPLAPIGLTADLETGGVRLSWSSN
ncbi:MAG: putative lipoprotein, partial [bacterium]